jgi:hypothetical protein
VHLRDKSKVFHHNRGSLCGSPIYFDKVRRQGREGVFEVSRSDLIRQVADLLPLDKSHFSEQDVPFSVLHAAIEERPALRRI